MDKQELLCEEVLYVSDTATKSHFCVKNNKNKGRFCPTCHITETKKQPNGQMLKLLGESFPISPF
jgi:hypothetical protein